VLRGPATPLSSLRRVGQSFRRSWRDAITAVRGLTANARPLPGLLIIGAQRAGTTSFFDLLSGHPEVLPSLEKEVHYFDHHFERGTDWYRAQFPRGRPVALEGGPAAALPAEATPYYLFDPRVPARVGALLPEARFIVLLRHPVDRAYSHWARERRLGREPLDFEAAVAAEPARLASEVDRAGPEDAFDEPHHQYHSYLGRSRYAEQIERWLTHFRRERFLFLRSEDFYADPDAAVAAATRFLGLRDWSPESVRRLQQGSYAEMPATLREKLCRQLAPADRRLSEILGDDFGWIR